MKRKTAKRVADEELLFDPLKYPIHADELEAPKNLRQEGELEHN